MIVELAIIFQLQNNFQQNQENYKMLPIRKRPTLPEVSNHRSSQTPNDSMLQISRTLKELTEKINGIYENQKDNLNGSRLGRLQDRFQIVSLDIPKLLPNEPKNIQQRKEQLQIWLGQLCQQVFSITFKLYEYQKLNDNKTKSFCCQNMLSNIIKMIKINNLSAEQISHMDECLKTELIPYFLMKYPISEQAQINIQFESKIVEIDSIDDNQNDLIYKSKIQFNYKASGNYNQQIMRFLNYLIELPNLKLGNDSQQTLFKTFYSEIQEFFSKIQIEQFTLMMSKFDFKNISSNVHLNQNIMLPLVKLSIEEQKVKEKYIQAVRSYTKKKIGRKISQNIKPFSEIQIQQGQLILKNPSLMRIVTKWCEELMSTFQISRNILNKQQQFRMKDGSEKILKRRHLLVLAQLLKRQKVKVDEYLKKVSQNNGECHSDFSHQPIPKKMKKFCPQEYQVGHFAASTINNYQTYLVGYINTIIHSLMSAIKDYQQMVKAYEYKQQQYGEYIEKWRRGTLSFEDLISRAYSYRLTSVPDSYFSFIPQLVSFRVGDILRCRCISKEKQIIALYTELQRISRTPGSQMKIMRIKNRLSKGTKDILINILYKNAMLIEMQLGIQTNVSKFIDFSNKFNHVLYELKRAEFGTISQMCNIWINNDIKSQFYVNYTKIANARNGKPDPGGHTCKGDPIQFPFRCTECDYFYNDCRYTLKHIQCKEKNCGKRICSLCRCQRFDYASLKSFFHQIPNIQLLDMKPNQKYLEYRTRLNQKRAHENDFMEGFESSGVLLDLKGQNLKPIYYKCVKRGKKTMIVEIVDFATKQMRVIKQIILLSQIKSFKKEYLMFSSNKLTQIIKPLEGDLLIRVITKYNFPKLMKKWYEKQKATVVFMNGDLFDQDISKISYQYPFVCKICFYQNRLQNIQDFLHKFKYSQIVDFGQNNIKKLSIKNKEYFQNNRMKVLYLNYNNVQSIDPSFIETFNELQELQLANNNIKQLPSNFSKLKNLKILNLSRNLFELLPTQVTQLQKLQSLYLYSSKTTDYKKIISLPQSFGRLINLRKINLNFNNLQVLPSSIGDLINLETLYIVENKLKNLPPSFSKLKNLKVLNLAQNQFQELPQQIGSLTNLQILNLQNSSKTQFSDKRVPQGYVNLVKMKMMDISQNNLTSLPSQLGKMKMLQTLFVYQNKLIIIPDSIGKLKYLRLLYASNNKIIKLPDSICELQNLQKLTIKQNAQMQYLPAEIGKLKKLKFLIANDNNIRQLPASIGELQHLQQLLLKGNNITSLPASMKKLTQLTRLQLDVQKLNGPSKKIFNL